jgi:glycosyltransferase involved in cell wall biosynthesis
VRILIAHSFYRVAGGEDRYVRQQVELLGARHEVLLLERSNTELQEGIRTAARMTYSRDERAGIDREIDAFRPDVIHLHNPYPSLGPVVHLAAEARRIPLVVTVHNFRLRCPNGLNFTHGAPCRRCEGGAYANAVIHHCFPTAAQSTAYAFTLWMHRFVLGLERRVGVFVAPSRFMSDRLREWGIPSDRTALIRNYTDLPIGDASPGSAGMYLGRLSGEKGLDILLRALRAAGDPPFRFVGEGPAAAQLQRLSRELGLQHVRFLGRLDREGVVQELRLARFVAFSSRWDENAPLAALEAMAAGRPLIVTRTGGLSELVASGAGISCEVGDVDGLAEAVTRLASDDELCRSCGTRGLELAASEYSPGRHLARLDEVYEGVAGAVASTPAAAPRASRAIPSAGRAPRPATPGPSDGTGTAAAAPLGVLMAHCYYRDLGGENLSFEAEASLVEGSGARLVWYTRDNREIGPLGPLGKARLAARTVWADDSYRALDELVARERPDVAHFQNTFPLISPAAYHACRRHGAAVVQALRNYRLVCANGVLFRDGHVCEDCLGRSVPWPGVAHACYRDSRTQSGAVVAMLSVHRMLGTWERDVDVYLVPSEFSRAKFIEAGLPAEKLLVKPNFVHPDPGPNERPGEYALFAGRLAREKGVLTLLEAWRRVGKLPLKIAGDGPLRTQLRRHIAGHGLADSVELLGYQTPEQVVETMRGARIAIFPSEWYETFGRVAVEAFACGVPVIASNMGAMAEVVTDGRTGLHFTPGDPEDLAARVSWAWAHPAEVEAMGRHARHDYETRFTAARNLAMLMDVYRTAIDRASLRRTPARSSSDTRGDTA